MTDAEPMRMTDFFTLPDQAEEFAQVLYSIEPEAGKWIPDLTYRQMMDIITNSIVAN